MQAGDMLGRYRLVTRIARGGMGEVWLASVSGSGGFTKRVVIKTVLPERSRDPAFAEMLAREARMCAELNHPHLIEVFDFIEHDHVFAIAMEYVVGRSLSQIVRAARAKATPIPAWAALRMIWECCRGLEVAHASNIIHCDLSPGNIMLSFTGVTKVLDFGVAHWSGAGQADRLKGKYHYMAPERIKSLTTDRRTDVYALGVILYVLFTGRLPITAPTDEALLLAIVEHVPPPPSTYRQIEPEIEALIGRAMNHDPAQRFQTVGALLHAISQCRDGRPGACSQLDLAMYLGTLFPDAPDLPQHVRLTLQTSSAPVPIATEETQRKLSLLAYGSTELDELDSISIDVMADAAPLVPIEAMPTAKLQPPRRPPTHEPTAATAAGRPVRRPPPPVPPAAQGTPPAREVSKPIAVSQLFDDAAAARATHSGVFDSPSGLGEGTGSPIDGSPSGIFDSVRPHEPGPMTARGAFGDSAREGEEPAWPWAPSLIKPPT